jgi:hypothetical protein
MNRSARSALTLLSLSAVCLEAPRTYSQQTASNPLPGPDTETVYSVYHVIAGKEAAFEKVRTETWALYLRLGLVLPKPHVVVLGTDDAGKPYYVEIFTWKNASIPDHAPPEVHEIWKRLQGLCEPRGGRPGIDYSDGGVSMVEYE